MYIYSENINLYIGSGGPDKVLRPLQELILKFMMLWPIAI